MYIEPHDMRKNIVGKGVEELKKKEKQCGLT